MIDYGIVESTVKPNELQVFDDVVFTATDIQSITRTDTDGEDFNGYQYNYKEYTNSEYIKLQSNLIDNLNSNLLYLSMMTEVDLWAKVKITI